MVLCCTFNFQPSNGKVKFTVELNLTTGTCEITPQDPLAPSPATTTPHPPLRTPHSDYSLRKGLGFWRLTFDGKEAELRHERGIFYVAWLLANPPHHPIHALDLAAKIPEIYRRHLGLEQIAAHLEKHLLIPSARYCGPPGAHARGPLAGSFIYEPPPGVTWAH